MLREYMPCDRSKAVPPSAMHGNVFWEKGIETLEMCTWQYLYLILLEFWDLEN